MGGLRMPLNANKSDSDNETRDENGCSAISADGDIVLECSDFEIDIDFETDLGAGQYLMDDTANLNADHGIDILDTQWDCYPDQDMLISTTDTTTEHGSSSRDLQFEDEAPLPNFPLASNIEHSIITLASLPQVSSVAQNGNFSMLNSAGPSTGDQMHDSPPHEPGLSFTQAPNAALRPFHCGIHPCSKSYKRLYELKRHQLSHSPVKSHSCPFMMCNRSGLNGFARKDHLKQHLRQVHGI